MNHLISCTLVANLALSGIALDSKTWARFYPGLPHAPLIEPESAATDEPQSIYHFSGASEVLSLAGAKTTRFEDTTLTADDLQDSLTFTLTTTHADGTTQTHTLPLAPDSGTITH